jgi:endonuclease/exonuclease/phosphatase family metal-dependent hydrolase
MKDRSKLTLLDKIVLWLNALLALSLVLSYFAAFVGPQTTVIFAFFGLGYPFLLTANIILIAWWLLRRKWLWLLSFACILCGWNVLNNTIGFRFGGASAARPTDTNNIRVMTYNVHYFKRYGAKIDISTKHEILDIVRQEQPDVICFQEFFSRMHGQYDMRDSVVQITGAQHYYLEPVIYDHNSAIGIAIFSKYEIIGHGLISFTGKASENEGIYVDLLKGNKKFRVYTIHLQSIRFDPEDYQYINNITHAGTTDVSSARRLGAKLKTAFIKRSAQAQQVKDDAEKCPYPYIIAGDFNDTPASFAFSTLSKRLKNTFREKGSGIGRTYNGEFPNYQIDYIMASPQFDVASYLVIEKQLSDHYPVMSDLLLVH